MTDVEIADRIAIGVIILAHISLTTPIFAWTDFSKISRWTRAFLRDSIDEIDKLAPAFNSTITENRPKILRGKATLTNRDAALKAPLSGLPCLAWQIGFGHPINDDLIVLTVPQEDHDVISFLVEGHTFISLKKHRFSFPAVGHVERREFHIDDLSPAMRKTANHLLDVSWTNKTLKKHGRFYEWILPPDASCVVVGEARANKADYRLEEFTELTDALIFVAPPDDDPATLDKFRQFRASARLEIQRLSRERRLTGYVALVGVAISAWLFWTFFTTVDVIETI